MCALCLPACSRIIYVKLEKCEFHIHRCTMTFLGYVLSPAGVEMDQSKVLPITEWSVPATVEELQRFLGFTNFYRCFIQNYSTVAGPLTSLLKGKPKTLHWSESAQEAFNRLKNSFTTIPILCHPNPEAPFIIEVDPIQSLFSQRISSWHLSSGT
ncbi:hypothetical protein QTP86_004492 [Hemibagrus guttatus]|nr:hypothetical protein QTP86_004492 [Hemibagrus guttatus]